MAVNKVIYGNDTLIDLTGDTATAEDVTEGKLFHLASGVQATGTRSGGGSSSNLYFTNIACSATTGDFATVSDPAITADHVVAELVFSNPNYVRTAVTWTTSNGSLVLNGRCWGSITASVVLIKKDN